MPVLVLQHVRRQLLTSQVSIAASAVNGLVHANRAVIAASVIDISTAAMKQHITKDSLWLQ